MKTKEVALPVVGLIAVTRGMLGAGVGLLVADRIGRHRRVAVGRTLVAIGALSTIPLLASILSHRR